MSEWDDFEPTLGVEYDEPDYDEFYVDPSYWDDYALDDMGTPDYYEIWPGQVKVNTPDEEFGFQLEES